MYAQNGFKELRNISEGLACGSIYLLKSCRSLENRRTMKTQREISINVATAISGFAENLGGMDDKRRKSEVQFHQRDSGGRDHTRKAWAHELVTTTSLTF